jgi:hypothetical protein
MGHVTATIAVGGMRGHAGGIREDWVGAATRCGDGADVDRPRDSGGGAIVKVVDALLSLLSISRDYQTGT